MDIHTKCVDIPSICGGILLRTKGVILANKSKGEKEGDGKTKGPKEQKLNRGH